MDILDENFSRLFSCISEVTIYLEREGNIAKADQNLSKLVGYSLGDVLTKQLTSYLQESEQERFDDKFQEALGGSPTHLDTFLIHNSGKLIPVHILLIPSAEEGKEIGVLGIIKDQSENISSFLLNDQLRAILDDAMVGVYIIKGQHLLYGNPYCHKLLGTTYLDANMNVFHFIHPEDLLETKAILQSLKNDREGIIHSVRLIRKDGFHIRVETQFKVLFLDKDPIFLGTVMEVTEREKALERIQFLANYDQLTQLPNRNFFKDALEKQLILTKVLNQELSVMYLDLDSFTSINDALGHHVGDELLVAVSKRLQGILDENQMLFRIGGNEFAIISSDFQMTTIIELAERIKSVMAAPFLAGTSKLFMTISMGISHFPNDGEDSGSIMKKANVALRHAKMDGKNTYKVYTDSMYMKTFRAFKLGADFRIALEENQLEFYFQPKVNLTSNKIVGTEAFIRWNHPELGPLLPKEFLPSIKDHRLIEKFGKEMTWKLVKQWKAWQDKGLPRIPISFNLWTNQFTLNKELVGAIEEILTDTNLDPEFLELEITESNMVGNEDVMVGLLQDLMKTGITISLDDFGTDQSSLSYLNKFNKYIHVVKIHSSFITKLSPNKETESNVITKGMIKLAEALRKNVVADGVETYEQVKLLNQMGCKIAQGAFFLKPLPATKFEKFLSIGTISTSDTLPIKTPTVEEGRKLFRIPLYFPLSGFMTVTRINGRSVNVKNTEILIEDIGLGGLRFLSDIRLAVSPNIILQLEFCLFGETKKYLGTVVWMEEVKPAIYQYGFQFMMEENERAVLTPILNKLAIKLRKAPLIPDCKFVTENRYYYINQLRNK